MHPHQVNVPPEFLHKAEIWAEKVGFQYRQLDDPKRVYPKPHRQVIRADHLAKIAETAVGMILGALPEFESIGQGDGGVDLRVPINGRTYTIDVKSSDCPQAQFLVWPLTQDFSKIADFLVFARTHQAQTLNEGLVDVFGWITGTQFIKLCSVAPANHPLKEGTRYMNAHDLIPIHLLEAAVDD